MSHATSPPAAARNRVVVGIDGSGQSLDALRWAVRLARAEDADLDVVAAWDYPPTVGWGCVPVDCRPDRDAEMMVARFLAAVHGYNLPDRVRTHIERGTPADVLLRVCRDATAVVVGSRNQHGRGERIVDSVSATLAKNATCPVLVVRGREAHAPTPPGADGVSSRRGQ